MEVFEGFKTLFIGMFIFFVTNLVLGSFGPRSWLIDKYGFIKYRAGHSVLSLLGLYFIIIGFSSRPLFPIYYPSYEDYKLTGVLMTIALMFLAASFSSKEFTAITKHPVLWAVFIFSISHLKANGDLGAVFLFGGFVIYVPVAMYISERCRVLGNEKGFEKTFESTSIIPFLAIMRGKVSWPKGVFWLLKPIVIGLILVWFIVDNHKYITGVELVFN
ncbi:MAG: NnrU family protein [Sphingomonadales bacterium]